MEKSLEIQPLLEEEIRMEKHMWAVAGSFAMRPGTVKGIHVFQYEPESGTLVPNGRYRTEINAGQRAYDEKKRILYVTHEGKDFAGERGTGGRIFAVKVNEENGTVEWLNEQKTLAALPSDICLSKDRKYLLVPHHATGDLATKTVRNQDGDFEVQTIGDDCTLVLFERNEDGTIGKILDVYIEGQEEDGMTKKPSRFHCCVQAPDENLFLVCDKGKDCIHSFRIDEEKGKLVHLNKTFVETDAHPRYGVFHPELPVFYQNCENSAFLHVWKYDAESGKLSRIQKIALLADEKEAEAWKKEGASDFSITADGKYLYAAVRGLNVISSFHIKEDGSLKFMQCISCEGKNPRGIELSPDERYLFAMNRDTDQIIRFAREDDGTLRADGCAAECELPGNLVFLTCPFDRPEHVRETKSQKWKAEHIPQGKTDPIFPYGKILKFRDNVYSIFEKSFDGHGDPWMHLIIGPEKAMLIDTGFGVGDLRGLVEKLSGGKPLIVVNTHPHLDHCYGNCQFEKVYCHKFAVRDLEKQNEHMWDHLMDENGKGKWIPFDRSEIVPFKKYEIEACENGTIFDLGDGYEVEAVFMPGHDPGHFCFLDKKDRILYGGDSLLYVAGMGHGKKDNEDTPYKEYRSVEAFRNELEKLAGCLDEFDCVFMSHMVLGEDRQLVKDLFLAADVIVKDPDSNQFVHHDKRTGEVNKVRTHGMAAVEYWDGRIYMK